MVSSAYNRILIPALCAILLMMPSIWNHFPLVTSDTGAYIENAYHLSLPNDRPLTYSYFTLFTSLHLSLWLTILVQSMLLSLLILSFIAHILQRSPDKKQAVLTIILLCALTSCSWYTSQVMPDIFTPMIFLASVNYYYATTFKIRLIYILLIYSSILTHNSNLVITLLFYTIVFVIGILMRTNPQIRKKAATLLIVSVLSWLTLCSLHAIGGFGFRPSKSSHIFLIAKLSENGVLKEYLDTHCQKEQFRLCSYKNSLPDHAWDFIWNDDGPFAHSGYWDSSGVEYSNIIKGTLTEPHFIWMNVKESLKATMRQFILTNIGDGLTPQVEGSNPFWKIQEHYRSELIPYLKSKQSTGAIHVQMINLLYACSFILSFIVLFLLVMLKKLNLRILFIIALTILFCLINAFTTASLANILARLNSRCLWLIPFVVIIVLVELIWMHGKQSNLNLQHHATTDAD